MFEFAPLDHNPANAVRVPGNIRVNLCFHSSLSVVQPKYRTRIGLVCTRRFPTLPADKSNGNSLSGLFACSSNPTFCNGRIVLSSFLFRPVFFRLGLCNLGRRGGKFPSTGKRVMAMKTDVPGGGRVALEIL